MGSIQKQLMNYALIKGLLMSEFSWISGTVSEKSEKNLTKITNMIRHLVNYSFQYFFYRHILVGLKNVLRFGTQPCASEEFP